MKDRRRVGLILAGVAVVLFIAYYARYQSAQRGVDVIPNPNGYDQIRQASLRIRDRLEDFEKLSDLELEVYLKECEPELTLLRQGLNLPSAVPVEFDANWITTQLPVMMGARNLGHALAVEAELFQRKGNLDQVVQSALDLVKLGLVVGNKGLAIDFMLGTACEIQGAGIITNSLEILDPDQCKAVIEILESLDSQRESLDSMFRREKRWGVAANGYLEYLKAMIEFRSWRPERSGYFNTQVQVNARLKDLRLIRIRIATQAFLLSRNQSPTNALELVPEFLKEVPLDPGTSQALTLEESK